MSKLSASDIFGSGSKPAERAKQSPETLLSADLEKLDAPQVLSKCLSVGNTIVVTSSYAAQSQNKKYVDKQCREIGTGLQGTIYERMDVDVTVIKKELPTNPGIPLRNEFFMHREACRAFDKWRSLSGGVHVPYPYELIPKEKPQPLLSKMPRNDQEPSDMALITRVYPLPKVVRKAMIERFYLGNNRFNVQRDPALKDWLTQTLGVRANKHCLAHIYLGKKEMDLPEYVTLRNWPLPLNVMEDLHLDIERFATMIGNAYGIMHWATHMTVNNVEFVLGTSATSPSKDYMSASKDGTQNRQVRMCLLDFGQCATVDMNGPNDTVFQAFKASMVLPRNQLYLPHPKESPKLYNVWKLAYLDTAKHIIDSQTIPFSPEEFLAEYEKYF